MIGGVGFLCGPTPPIIFPSDSEIHGIERSGIDIYLLMDGIFHWGKPLSA